MFGMSWNLGPFNFTVLDKTIGWDLRIRWNSDYPVKQFLEDLSRAVTPRDQVIDIALDQASGGRWGLHKRRDFGWDLYNGEFSDGDRPVIVFDHTGKGITRHPHNRNLWTLDNTVWVWHSIPDVDWFGQLVMRDECTFRVLQVGSLEAVLDAINSTKPSYIKNTINEAVEKLQQLEFDLDRETGSRRLLKSEIIVLQTELVNKNVLSWSDFI